MMRRIFWKSLALSLAAISAAALSLAHAQDSLSDLRARQEEERKLADEASYTGNVCGMRLSARIDWGRTRSWPEGTSIADACDTALGAVETICRAGDAQKVSGKISSFSCSGDGSGPSLSGSTLYFGASPHGNGFSATRAYLERAL